MTIHNPIKTTIASILCSLFLFPFICEARTLRVSQSELPNLNQKHVFSTISEAAQQVIPGDTIIIHGGIYREKVSIAISGTKDQPIVFQANPGEYVVITGADPITDWTAEDSDEPVFSTKWSHEFITWNESNTHPNDDYHRVIGRSEQVMIDHYLLRQVLDKQKLSPGAFFADLKQNRLYVWAHNNADLSNGKSNVEASTREQIWVNTGDHIHLNGLRFRYAANRAQQAAVEIKGNHNQIKNCVFEFTNSIGATFQGVDCLVQNCVFQQNGQMGFSVYRAHGLLFTNNTVRDNNTKGYSRGWEAGGNKIVLTRNAIFEKNQFTRNRGNGIWFDIGNEACIVRNNLIAHNENAGVFYEISYGLHVHDNVIIGNGFANSEGAWGANGGISLSSSPNCIIERNLIVGNKEGIQFREQYRTTPLIDQEGSVPVWNHDSRIQNNILAYNQDAQLWGWFDINDQRHWPTALQDESEDHTSANEDIAQNYKLDTPIEALSNLSLSKLNLTINQNVYARHSHQGLFHWGVTWKKNIQYQSLQQVQKDLNFETEGKEAIIYFNDYHALDLTVISPSHEFIQNAYPQGEIPGVILGFSNDIESIFKK